LANHSVGDQPVDVGARPNSSNATASFAQPNPAPPYLSGIAMPGKPGWPAMIDQVSRSKLAQQLVLGQTGFRHWAVPSLDYRLNKLN
jgi:hypothetical protein